MTDVASDAADGRHPPLPSQELLKTVGGPKAQNRRVHPDLDDTRAVARERGAAVPAVPDVEDTVVRIPELVEPPEFERPVVGAPVVERRRDRDDDAGSPRRSTTEAAGPVVEVRGIGSFPLDSPVIIGRRPSRTRIHRGPDPRLVTVPSPSKEISASHVQIRRHGTAIVVSDLKSTNGTIVTLPGHAPRTLLRGESAVVIAGTIIELGDGIVLEILPGEPA